MFIKKYGDLISGVVLLIFTGLYASQIGSIKIIDTGSVDAAFIPKLVAGAMLLLSGCLIVTSVFKLKAQGSGKAGDPDGEEAGAFYWLSTVLTVFLLLLYVALFEKIGFLITTSIYLFAQLMVLAPDRTWKKTAQFAAVSVVSAVALQFIFIRLLYVMLPEGILR